MNLPGFLLVIEGIDGAGKSTLQGRLADWCREQGRTVTTSREPTDGPHGRALRESARTGRLGPEAELELFLKDRHEHVTNVIRPALERGDVMILDRYYFSTAAYQGARGINPEKILAANEAFAPIPDLVLLLDLDPGAGHQRIGARGSAPDSFEGAAYLAKVRKIFLGFDRPFIRRIDAARGPEEVAGECEEILRESWELSYGPEHAAKALEIVERLLPHVSVYREYAVLVCVLRDPARWKDAHSVFDEIRQNITLPLERAKSRSLDYYFVFVAENAAKTAYNCSGGPAPFDNDSFEWLLKCEAEFLKQLDMGTKRV